jgi:hypothetical protein
MPGNRTPRRKPPAADPTTALQRLLAQSANPRTRARAESLLRSPGPSVCPPGREPTPPKPQRNV